MVRVAVTGPPVMVAGLVDPKLKVGGSVAFAGEALICAVSETVPVNPVTGVSVICTVLPVIAPGVTETDGEESVNPGAGELDTTTVSVPVAAG